MSAPGPFPSLYSDATCEHVLLRGWVSEVSAGNQPKLLVLAPGMSGKTWTLWAAARALAEAGVAGGDVMVRETFEFGVDAPDTVETLRHRVVLVDGCDRFDPEYHRDVDGDPGYVPRHRDETVEPDLLVDDQEFLAEVELRAGDLRNLVSKLTHSDTHAALLTATSPTTLRRAFEPDLADRLLEWPTIALPKRPQDDVITWG